MCHCRRGLAALGLLIILGLDYFAQVYLVNDFSGFLMCPVCCSSHPSSRPKNSWINTCVATKKLWKEEKKRKRELCLCSCCASPVLPFLPRPVTGTRKWQVDNLAFSKPRCLRTSVPALASSHTMNRSFIPDFARGQWEHTLPVHHRIWCSLTLLATSCTDSFSAAKEAKMTVCRHPQLKCLAGVEVSQTYNPLHHCASTLLPVEW